MLYPFNRATSSKAFIPLGKKLKKKEKKKSARERPMEREKVAEVLLDFLFKGPGQMALLG